MVPKRIDCIGLATKRCAFWKSIKFLLALFTQRNAINTHSHTVGTIFDTNLSFWHKKKTKIKVPSMFLVQLYFAFGFGTKKCTL